MNTVKFGIVVLVLAVALSAWAVRWGRETDWAREPDADVPVLVCPGEIELGEHELGEVAVARFTIRNEGRAELVISNVSTSGSCTGLEREEGGEYVQVTRLVVPPLQQAPLAIRQSVRGVPVGSSAFTTVHFETNDPSQAAASIKVMISRVKGGVHPSPSSIVVGSVPLGQPVSRVVEIRDDALTPRVVSAVTSSDPERVRVRLLPPPSPASGVRGPGGFVIARVEVDVATSTPGVIDAYLAVTLQGDSRPPDVVRVLGNVLPPVELSPSTLSLPRAGFRGPVYEAAVVCRSPSGRPARVSISRAPEGVSASVMAGAEARVAHTVNVSIDPAVVRRSFTVDVVVAYADGDSQSVSIPVRFQPQE